MKTEFEDLKEKFSRVHALESEAETIRNAIATRDRDFAKERGLAIVRGTDIPKQTKDSVKDLARLAEIESCVPYALEILNTDAIQFRNALATRLNEGHGRKNKVLDAKRAELVQRMKDASDELTAFSTGPELRMLSCVETSSILLGSENVSEILTISDRVFSEYGDFINEPEKEAN